MQVWTYQLPPDFSHSLICQLSRNAGIPLQIALLKKDAVMDCIFASTQNSYVETLTTNGIVLGGGTLGK